SLARPTQLRTVATSKLLPFVWVVREPLAKPRARSQFLAPFINARSFFADPAGPNPIYEDSYAIARTGVTVYTFDVRHVRLLSPVYPIHLWLQAHSQT